MSLRPLALPRSCRKPSTLGVGSTMLLCAALASACSTESVSGIGANALTLTTGKTVYYSGDEIRVSVNNRTERPFWSGACIGEVEMRVAGRWHAAPNPYDGCLAVMVTYAPGEIRNVSFVLPAASAPGQYRLRLNSPRSQDGEIPADDVQRTNAFEVRPGFHPLSPPGEG